MSLVLHDFENVFGRSLNTIIPRISKGISVLRGMMKGTDAASEKMPIRLQIEITDKCNFDCVMCNRGTRKHVHYPLQNDLPYEAFLRLFDSVQPYYVTINGLGEPLLYKDITRVLAACRAHHVTTAMPTNLSLAKQLNETLLASPPDILTFSIHSASKEAFESISRGAADYERCIQNARLFLSKVDRKKITVRVLCALQRGNLLEYRAMYRLLCELDLLDHLELVPVFNFRGLADDSLIIPSEDERKRAVDRITAELQTCRDERQRAFYLSWRGQIAAITPMDALITGPCLVPWFSTYVTARGLVLPCCYLTEEHYVMGNILQESFASIWNNDAYRKFRRTLREDRGQLEGCRYCPRVDTRRIQKYGFMFGKTLWKVQSLSL